MKKFFLGILVLFFSLQLSAQVSLFKDINMSSGTESADVKQLVNIDGIVYFAADDGINGRELWTSDGTEEGTALCADIYEGEESSFPSNLTNFQGQIYFAATDNISGYELYKYDDINKTAELFFDINPGEASSFPSDFAAIDNTLFFVANNIATGREIWITNGEQCETQILEELVENENDAEPINLFQWKKKIYFSAKNLLTGIELWKIEEPHFINLYELYANSYCSNADLYVDFAITGDYNSDNIFTLQFSDKDGDFTNSTTIYSEANTIPFNIQTQVPADLPSGENYRIRMLASSPEVIGQTSCQYFTIMQGPAITQIQNQQTDENIDIQIPIVINDAETSFDNLDISFTSTNMELVKIENISISGNENKLLIIKPTQNLYGTAEIQVTVKDQSGCTISTKFDVEVISVNDSPYLNVDIDNQTASYKKEFMFTFEENTFVDPDQDILTYSAKLSDNSELPAWLSFDSDTRTFSGLPEKAGTYNIVLTAYDSENQTDICEFDIIINKVFILFSTKNETREYQQSNPELIYEYEGLIEGDNIEMIDKMPTISTTALIDSDAGEYPIEIKGGEDDNYDFNYANATLTVTPIEPKVTLSNITLLQDNSITCDAEVTNTGGEPELIRGICWKLNKIPTTEDNTVEKEQGIGTFQVNFKPNIFGNIYIRSFATNSVNTTYSEVKTIEIVNSIKDNINNCHIIPNPCSDNFYISSSQIYNCVKILDISGKTITTFT